MSDLTSKLCHPTMPATTSPSRFKLFPYVTETPFPARHRDISPHAWRAPSTRPASEMLTRMISTTGAEAASFGPRSVSKTWSVGGPLTRCFIEAAKDENCAEVIKALKESSLSHSIQ